MPKNDVDTQTVIKILGLKWNVKSDTLQVPGPLDLETRLVSTKRDVVQANGQIYNPLGYLCLCTLAAKSFLQALWDKNSEK